MPFDKEFLRPVSGIELDGRRFLLAVKNALGGLAVGVAFLLTVAAFLGLAMAYMGAVWFGVYAVVNVPEVYFALGIVALVAVWWTCFVGGVLALDALGIQLRGTLVFLCLPLAPAVLVLAGPIALFGGLGRLAGERSVFVPLLGLALVAALLFLLLVLFR